MSVVSCLTNTLASRLVTPTPIVLAYSGGLDSQVLLSLLARFRSDHPQHTYRAVHVHHGLSPYADTWRQHCEQQCASYGIPLQVAKVEIRRQGGESLEALARATRYQSLLKATPDKGILLLAQHQDDQLETFLLQLKRGAGPKGLASMAEVTQSERGICLIRPLLGSRRDQILHYARAQGLIWQEDDSNQNERFDRNFLRHTIIPQLINRWPHMAATVSRSAALCAEQQHLLDEITAMRLNAVLQPDNSLDIDKLTAYSWAWQRQIVRNWLADAKVPLPTSAQLEQLLTLLNAADDANPVVRWQNWQLRRFHGRIYLLAHQAPPQEVALVLLSEQVIPLPDNLGSLILANSGEGDGANVFALEPNPKVKIRFSSFAEKFKPQDARHSKPLKQWFKQWQIPPWQRSRTPQVWLDDQLVAVFLPDTLVLAEQTPTDYPVSLQVNRQ